MAYKQSPGRMNMPKTGRGVDTVALMTGTPAPLYQKTDALDGDKLPTYTVTNTNTSRTGGGSSTSTNSNSNSSSSSSNSKPKVTRETAYANRSAKYKNMNQAEYNVEIDKYNAKKNKQQKPQSSTTSNNNSKKTEVQSETKTIGTQTKNDVALEGKEANVNARSKREAERLAKIVKVKKDSSDFSNQKRKEITRDGKKPLYKNTANKITTLANKRARRDITSTVGARAAELMFPTASHYRTGPKAGTEGGVFTEEDFK